MPNRQPVQSYQRLRDYMEKFSWVDARYGIKVTGYCPPKNAQDVERVPFHIKYVTKSGRLESGVCVCTSVVLKSHQRRIRFVDSGQTRMVNDILILEVDGTRFVAH